MGQTTDLVTPSTLFQEAIRMVLDILDKGRRSKRNKQILRSTLKNMTGVVQEIQQFNERLNPPREEINTLVREKDAGEKMVCKICSRKLWWFSYLSWLPLHRGKFWHNSNDSFTDDKQIEVIKATLYKVRAILVDINNENFEQKLNHVGAPIKCPFGVPENPDFTVGLEVPLSKLKTEVLTKGTSIVSLTGLGGSGKTTLATKLCWDEDVKGKFRENILFVTFSQTPKLKNIVERLFEHCGYYQVPVFQNDEDAIKRLELLLRKVEERPLLMVLDDVWPGSEALVENLKFPISNYKILVTSRVAFPRFGTQCILKPLVHDDAMILFRHYALFEKSSSSIPDELVQKVVKYCKGLPLAIKVIGNSLSHQPYELWQKMVEELSQGHSILDSNTELLICLRKLLDVLEGNPKIKECFMDLGLFPEGQRIPVPALIDMWAELYELDDDGTKAMEIIKKLDSMNLANVLVARKNTSDSDNYYYNNHVIVLHDLLRELAIYLNTQEPMEKRKRQIIHINENKGEWWLGEKQSGMIAHLLSKCIRWYFKPNPQKVPARTLSISTDESCTSYWSHTQPAQVEVLILNLQTKQFSFPEIMEKMNELQVLIVNNYGFHPSELNNFKLLGSVANLKRIRLEKINIPHLGALKNLKKLSLYMCSDVSQAFENGSIRISDAFPNLVDLNIDYCKDIVGLATGVCDITPLKKLSITNCHKLKSLPQEIGKLGKLEILRLNSCTDLEGMPDSIGRLSNLRLLDISNCISLPSLPEDFGNLCNLRNLYMTSCARCELPHSVINLENLKIVTCDEETAVSWEAFEPMLPNLKIEIPHVDVNLNWLHSVST